MKIREIKNKRIIRNKKEIEENDMERQTSFLSNGCRCQGTPFLSFVLSLHNPYSMRCPIYEKLAFYRTDEQRLYPVGVDCLSPISAQSRWIGDCWWAGDCFRRRKQNYCTIQSPFMIITVIGPGRRQVIVGTTRIVWGPVVYVEVIPAFSTAEI